ncbi:hypothetical protein ZHAS_00005037 [Anopheles sinensis]|uniref:Uncharacterized protein n=1 Tax=Anopheles sinensis TaxID=74873 RepID=A0A084VID2_ANOSI|nr:hypothetical protein ZHAS_00005037 [Anopheles sinensis]
MRHVKKDYEACATLYQSTMAKLGQAAATTTTTSTTFHPVGPTMATHPAAALRSGQYNAGHDVSQQRHHHHHQHDHAGYNGHPNSTKSVEDAEEERLKTVCCAFQKYMQCSEFTVRHACGDETALFTRKFLDKMSNTLMRRLVDQFRSMEFLINHLRTSSNGSTFRANVIVYGIAIPNTKVDNRERSSYNEPAYITTILSLTMMTISDQKLNNGTAMNG